jgi:mannose-6-phosphate isomerase-like protein (cupin superfamily)
MCVKKEYRPWGFYEILADEQDHKVKRITVYPGKRLSLQRHRWRNEHWYFMGGKAVVTVNNSEFNLQGGQSVDIPQGTLHRLMNRGEKDVVYIEVQTGSYFGEDDIERIEDDYGRV